MIVAVYGSVDGAEVIFTPSGPDTWTCKVPKATDGEYIVDLYAVNDAGNKTYFATVLFTVRGVDVTVTWLTIDTAASMSKYDVRADNPRQYDVRAVMLSCIKPRVTPGL